VVALPIWIGYMEKALKDVPEAPRTMPPGVVSVPIGPLPGANADAKSVAEYFYSESVPPPDVLNPPPEPERPPLVGLPSIN
jgi:membrane carboxypeptidase/penicillin-binding protein